LACRARRRSRPSTLTPDDIGGFWQAEQAIVRQLRGRQTTPDEALERICHALAVGAAT
jgi:hypothetical protein